MSASRSCRPRAITRRRPRAPPLAAARTREDIARLTDQLDRMEAALAELADRVEAAKPKRRAASTGSAKPES
jgi:hypothetical protein